MAHRPFHIFGDNRFAMQYVTIFRRHRLDHPGHVFAGDSMFPFVENFQMNLFGIHNIGILCMAYHGEFFGQKAPSQS
jgi:hypothetical protein